jgi:membrane peptidoglycan carboxypeptidase
MVENGAIDRKTATDAKAHPAALIRSAQVSEGGTWFSGWVAQEALDVTGTFAGNMRVRTTLDPQLQSLAEQVIADAFRETGDRHISQAALVAMRPGAVQAQRQPGSAFKLFVYMAALRSGFALEDTIDAAPLEIDGWRPDNFGGHVYGAVTLADQHSDRPSCHEGWIRSSRESRARSWHSYTSSKGPQPGLGRVRGELAQSDSGLRRCSRGASADAGSQQALGDLQALLIRLLQLPIEGGTAREAALKGFFGGKTGTTQDNRDAWFIGFRWFTTGPDLERVHD